MARPESHLTTAYGIPLEVRPVTPEDRAALAEAFRRLSERARHDRFLGPKPRLSSAELTYLTEIDHRTHEALAAVDPEDGALIGVARYATVRGERECAEMAVFVIDAWQGQGVATMLGRRLLRRAAENGITRLTATTFADNRPARSLLRRLGFRTTWFGGGVVELERA
jgi:RimJ/RimL family protein N-acetyltransferase